jgi:hypothetical protein
MAVLLLLVVVRVLRVLQCMPHATPKYIWVGELHVDFHHQ